MTSRVAAVTGGSAGIGRAICEDLLAQGYEVVSLARRPAEIDHPKLHSLEVDLAVDRARDLFPGRNRRRRAGASRWRTRRPADVGGAGVGGLMASLDSYHLDLVVAVLWHAGSGSPTPSSSNDSAGQWL